MARKETMTEEEKSIRSEVLDKMGYKKVDYQEVLRRLLVIVESPALLDSVRTKDFLQTLMADASRYRKYYRMTPKQEMWLTELYAKARLAAKEVEPEPAKPEEKPCAPPA